MAGGSPIHGIMGHTLFRMHLMRWHQSEKNHSRLFSSIGCSHDGVSGVMPNWSHIFRFQWAPSVTVASTFSPAPSHMPIPSRVWVPTSTIPTCFSVWRSNETLHSDFISSTIIAPKLWHLSPCLMPPLQSLENPPKPSPSQGFTESRDTAWVKFRSLSIFTKL